MTNNRKQGHLCAFLTIFIWGTTFISTKILLTDMTPLQILFTRFVIGYLTLWIMYPHRCTCLLYTSPLDKFPIHDKDSSFFPAFHNDQSNILV